MISCTPFSLSYTVSAFSGHPRWHFLQPVQPSKLPFMIMPTCSSVCSPAPTSGMSDLTILLHILGATTSGSEGNPEAIIISLYISMGMPSSQYASSRTYMSSNFLLPANMMWLAEMELATSCISSSVLSDFRRSWAIISEVFPSWYTSSRTRGIIPQYCALIGST